MNYKLKYILRSNFLLTPRRPPFLQAFTPDVVFLQKLLKELNEACEKRSS